MFLVDLEKLRGDDLKLIREWVTNEIAHAKCKKITTFKYEDGQEESWMCEEVPCEKCDERLTQNIFIKTKLNLATEEMELEESERKVEEARKMFLECLDRERRKNDGR